MADIFREVDEEVRRDKALEAWERYQPWFIGAALVVIAATGAYRAYDYTRVKAEEAAGLQYEAAVQTARAGKSAEAQAALETVAKTGPDGYKSLALMRDAAVIAAVDPAGGVAAFDALAKNPALARRSRMSRDCARQCCAPTTPTPRKCRRGWSRWLATASPTATPRASFWPSPP